jgi:ADP-ribose pyrophosphatase YjhB (NUDIX family)
MEETTLVQTPDVSSPEEGKQQSYVQQFRTSAEGEIELSDMLDPEFKEVTPTAQVAEAATGAADESQTGEQTATEEGDAPKPTESDQDAILRQLAEETGVDLADPIQGKALKDLARQQSFVNLLTSKIAQKKETLGQSQQPPAEELTEFERSLMADAEQQPQPEVAAVDPQAAQPVVQQPPQGPQPMFEGDIGVNWTSPADAYTALDEAWKSDDIPKVHAIEDAIFMRRFAGRAMPVIQQAAERIAGQIVTREAGSVGDSAGRPCDAAESRGGSHSNRP